MGSNFDRKTLIMPEPRGVETSSNGSINVTFRDARKQDTLQSGKQTGISLEVRKKDSKRCVKLRWPLFAKLVVRYLASPVQQCALKQDMDYF